MIQLRRAKDFIVGDVVATMTGDAVILSIRKDPKDGKIILDTKYGEEKADPDRKLVVGSLSPIRNVI